MATAVTAMLALAADAQAAFPGRDGLIAFTRAEGSKSGQLYVIRPDGSELRRITHRRHGAGGASWSPDGRRILFTSSPRRGGVQVFVKRLGGGVRQLTRGRDTYAYPAWSPSGTGIVAVRGHIARDGLQYESVVTMRADGSRKRSIYAGGRLSTSYPAWSPDGTSIAFVHTDIGGTGACSPPRRSASSGPTAPATRPSPAAPTPRTARRPGPRAVGAWRSRGAAGS